MGVIDFIIYVILRLFGFISSVLSVDNRYKLGVFLGTMLRLADKKRERITFDNIKEALPEYNDNQCRNIVKKSYHNLGITLSELVAFPSFNEEDLRNYIEYDNIELITKLHSQGNGLIFLSGHFGNWELLAYSIGIFSNIPVTVIVKHQKNKYADKVLNKYRTLSGNNIVSMKKAARTIVHAIKNNEAVAMLADQSATKDKDVFVEFFGRPASTYEAPAALALKFNVPIIMGFAVRQKNHSYKVNLIELKKDGIENTKEGIKELTRRHVKILEEQIRKHPELWAWQHKRWKHIL